jgi:hypothetical protein
MLTLLAALVATAPLVVTGQQTARVLAFSDDGRRALVLEETHADGRELVLTYVVLGPDGRELELTSGTSAKLSAHQRVEFVGADQCREGAKKLADALADFSTVRVRDSRCAMVSAGRTLVDVDRNVFPLMPGSLDYVALKLTLRGDVWVNDDGPLVVVISPDPNTTVLPGVVEHVFLRADPRVNKRWPDP